MIFDVSFVSTPGDLPVFYPLPTNISGPLSCDIGVFGASSPWNDLCLAMPLVPHLTPLQPTTPTVDHCSPALAALLAPFFLSRPLPPLAGLAPP